MATGAGRQLAAQHSHSLEGWYAHVPGLRVLAPATLEDARGMLWPALQDPDPVVIFEHAQLYNLEGELADPAPRSTSSAPRCGARAAISRVVTYGGSLPRSRSRRPRALAAAGHRGRGDRPARAAAARLGHDRWRRCAARIALLVVDEGWRTGSLAAEIMAGVVERAFYELDAPPARVCSAEVPMPYAEAPRGRGAAAAGRRSSRPRCALLRALAHDRRFACRRSAPTWTRARCSSGASRPATR